MGVLNATGPGTLSRLRHRADFRRRRATSPAFTAGASRDAEPQHLYLPGPHRGVWNGTAAKTNQTLFITEAILDGMSLWQAGFKNVIALYGANGWTADHEKLLRENGTTEIYLCLDNDESGRTKRRNG